MRQVHGHRHEGLNDTGTPKVPLPLRPLLGVSSPDPYPAFVRPTPTVRPIHSGSRFGGLAPPRRALSGVFLPGPDLETADAQPAVRRAPLRHCTHQSGGPLDDHRLVQATCRHIFHRPASPQRGQNPPPSAQCQSQTASHRPEIQSSHYAARHRGE